jgi:hypothetical protein
MASRLIRPERARGAVQIEEAAESLGIGAIDLAARVVHLPIRHQSPACAFHVAAAIRAIRPDAVLVEGPRDADRHIEHLVDPRCRMPVAIYAAFIRLGERGEPLHLGAYYPLSDFAPELAALRAGREVGARCRFIDSSFAEQALSRRDDGASRPARNLQDESALRHSAFLAEVARRIGARDHDELWDRLYEADFRGRAPEDFFRGVLAYCALARRDAERARLEADGTLAREARMAFEIERETGVVVVVAGGYHVAALPSTEGREPEIRPLAAGEASSTTLMRYGFEQLDRLNGYQSGMPSPYFYQHLFEGKGVAELLAGLARELRRGDVAAGTADVVAALDQVRGLAALRGHAEPTRDDFLDGVRSAFVKGSEDVEGARVLAAARRFLAGDAIGELPPGAGRPPLVEDFERSAAELGISWRGSRPMETDIDLYRARKPRRLSRFFHRLCLLGVPFAERIRGPDFAAGRELRRIRERWRWLWRPEVESALVEASRYGASVGEAAGAALLERFAAAERGDGRSFEAARLLAAACSAGLHQRLAELTGRAAALFASDPDFSSAVASCRALLLLAMASEPLEAHRVDGLPGLAAAAWTRAACLLPDLARVREEDEEETLAALAAMREAAFGLVKHLPEPSFIAAQLRALADAAGANPTLAGAACGLLWADGAMAPDELARRAAGHLHPASREARLGARFVRGLLRTARSAAWQLPELLGALHAELRAMDDAGFFHQLPHLRLAFSELAPRDCDRVARRVAALAGGEAPRLTRSVRLSEAAALLASRVDGRVRECLRRDGLDGGAGPEDGDAREDGDGERR